MATVPIFCRLLFCRSISFKNMLLFLLILLVALVPLAVRYDQDSRDYEIQNLASKLEFFAERGASWVDVTAIPSLTQPAHMQTPAYRELVRTLSRIEQEFEVDNAVVMRREANSYYTYIAAGESGFTTLPPADDAVRNPCNPALTVPGALRNPCHPALARDRVPPRTGRFIIGQPVHIHAWFPATYKATNDTWLAGEMMHSQLFGGNVNGHEFDQFLQINTPLKLQGAVVAILMLNKFANPVARAVRAKTLRVIGLTVGILVVGLTLFGLSSVRMLRPLQNLTTAAGEVAQGNLTVALPPPPHQDEVGRLATAFTTMLEGLRQRDFIRDTFGRYLSKEVVEEVLGSPDGLKLGGELREVTILVSDLRGFTSLAEHLPPHQVIDILNRYLERMVDIIATYRGTVDEFQGDGILAFFGAPLAAADDRERALACAVAMQSAMGELNAAQRQRQLPELHMGIGINTGQVVVGNIGSEKRTKYGAVGSAINEAYRIESLTVGGQILISPSVYEGVQALLCIQGTQEVQLKGLSQPVTLYDVVGLRGTYACMVPEKTPETVWDLPTPLPVACFLIEGKTVTEHAMTGVITRLAATGAEATLTGEVALYSNVKLRLVTPAEPELSDVYAKVMALHPGDGAAVSTRVCLGFTSLPEDAKAFLARQRATARQHEQAQV